MSKIVSSRDQVLDSCGTPAYVAPEVLLKQPYHKEVDVWAIGVIMYLMICKVLPFTASEKRQTFKMIKYDQPNFMRNPFAMVSKQCIDLVKKMLIKDPSQRITSTDALNHPFFDILGDKNTNKLQSVFEVPKPPRSFLIGAQVPEGIVEESEVLSAVLE